MITTSYRLLFQLSVHHTYFEGSVKDCIRFLPGKITKKLLKRFGLKIAKSINGIEVYTNSRQSNAAFFNYVSTVTSEDRFDFDIITDSSLFWSVTELPVEWLGKLNYDSTLSTRKEDGTLLLQPALATGSCMESSGSVSIQFTDILNNYSDRLVFDVEFKARATQWNYYIINKSKIKLNDPGISVKNNPVSFEGPERVTTSDGTSALRFSSGSNLLPLSEVPKYKFDLVDNASSSTVSARSIFKGLPTPDPVHTMLVQVNGKNEIASPMYIYI